MHKNNYHEICELSIIRASNRVQLTKQVKVDNINNSNLDSLKIIRKTAEDLRKGISKQELIYLVEKFANEDGLTPAHRCLVGHNIINFDRKFLLQLWETHNKVFPFELYLDTLQMARGYAKQRGIIKPALNLGAACDLLGAKKVEGKHEACADTRNCYFLWQKLMDNVKYLNYIKRMPHMSEANEEASLSEDQ
jgi:DNA polymerase III alpha subunit (gram-positive type)